MCLSNNVNCSTKILLPSIVNTFLVDLNIVVAGDEKFNSRFVGKLELAWSREGTEYKNSDTLDIEFG